MPLQHFVKLLLNQSKQDNGLTLFRLLAIAGVSGIFISGTSPSAHSQVSGDFEARRNIGIINYAQKSYYRQNGEFANKLGQLKTGIPTQTNLYYYTVVEKPGYPITAQALVKTPDIKAVIGGVVAVKKGTSVGFLSKKCIADLPAGQGGLKGAEFLNVSPLPVVSLTCPKGYSEIK
jgi:hypothetical protein